MSNKNESNLPVLPVLVPFLQGVPSRRPYVVLRRAKANLEELVLLWNGLRQMVAKDRASLTRCHRDLVYNKIFSVDASIDELENCVSNAVKIEIAAELAALKDRRQVIRTQIGF